MSLSYLVFGKLSVHTDTMKDCSHFHWYYLRHLSLVISSPHALHVCEQVDSQQAQCEINEVNNAFIFIYFFLSWSWCHLSYYYINNPQEKYFWKVRFSYPAGVVNTLPREMRSSITLLSLYLWNSRYWILKHVVMIGSCATESRWF